MTKIISTEYGDYKKPGFIKTNVGIAAGSTAQSAVQLGAGLAMAKYLIPAMQKKSQSCDNVLLHQGVKDAFENSGLAQHGVEIIDVKQPAGVGRFSLINLLKGKCELVDITDISKLPAENQRLQQKLIDAMPKYMKGAIGDVYAGLIRNMTECGDNAFYLPKGKAIGVNIDKLGMAVFHEMGHAINHNCSIFWHGMQKLRTPMTIVSGVASTTALLKRKKVEGEEPKNAFDKASTFVKNNVGTIVTLSFVPIIAEELKATQRGNKLAEKVLSKEMFKKVKATNRFGALSYIAGAVLAGSTAVLASKVRDAVAKPKEI